MNNPEKKKSKKENRLRSIDWHLRLTQAEAEELTKLILISGQSRRDYVLNLARHGVVIDMTTVNKELVKQGTNINQIAKKINSGKHPDKAEILDTIKEMQAQWQSLKSVISAVLNAR